MTRDARAVGIPPLPDAWLKAAYSEIPQITEAITRRIRAEISEYQGSADEDFIGITSRAVGDALRAYVGAAMRGEAPDTSTLDVFRRLGRSEAEAGRSHETLRRCYAIATDEVTKRVLTWERRFHAPERLTAELSQSIFSYIDGLADLSTEGYSEVRRGAGEERRARLRVMAMLLQPGAPDDELAESAARIGWTLPARCTVIEVVRAGILDDELAELAMKVIDPQALAGRVTGRSLILTEQVPELGQLTAAIAALRPPTRLFVGPQVAWRQAPRSARLAAETARQGARWTEPVVRAGDHLLELIAYEAADAMNAVVDGWLAPFEALAPDKRVKLGQALSSWLETGGRRAPGGSTAEKSRQTLHYQVNQARELLGVDLTDRETRVLLMVGLRAALPRWEHAASAGPGTQFRTGVKKSVPPSYGTTETRPIAAGPA